MKIRACITVTAPHRKFSLKDKISLRSAFSGPVNEPRHRLCRDMARLVPGHVSSTWHAVLAMTASDSLLSARRAGIAQLVEHQLPKLRVEGSNPFARSIPSLPFRCHCFVRPMPGSLIISRFSERLPFTRKACRATRSTGCTSYVAQATTRILAIGGLAAYNSIFRRHEVAT